MAKGVKVLTATLFGLAILASVHPLQAACEGCGSSARDMGCVDLPSPFTQVSKPHTEDRIAKWRHGFEKVRVTWDKYFEVYPDEPAILRRAESVTFEKVRSDPIYFLDRNIQFDLYFSRTGSFYRPFMSPFTEDVYANFSAWGYGSDLWIKEARIAIHPMFYVERERKTLIDKISHLPAYTPIHVWGEVRARSESSAWIEVKKIEIIPEVALSEDILRHLELGYIQWNKKHYSLASQALEQALAIELPVNVEIKVYNMLARAYFEQRLYCRARNALVNSILRDDHDIANLIFLARVNSRMDKADESREAVEHAIAIDPSNAEAHAELGLALGMLNDLKGGYAELESAQKLSRNQLPEVHRNRAKLALIEGKLELARDELNQAVILRATDVDLKLDLGDVYAKLNDLEKARIEFRQARDLAPDRVDSYVKLASVLKIQADALKKDGKDDQAKKLYEEALENVNNAIMRDNLNVLAHSLKVEILRALGREEEAKKAAEDAAKLIPNSTVMSDFEKGYDLVYDRASAAGDWAGMEQATRGYLTNHQSPRHFSRLGNILASRPNPDLKSSAEAYEQAVKLDPANAEDWAALGHLRVRAADFAGAETALMEAVKLQPQNGAAWYDLALARKGLKNVEGTLAAADEAARLTKASDARLLAAHAHADRGSPEDLKAATDLATTVSQEATVEDQKADAQAILKSINSKDKPVEKAESSRKPSPPLIEDNQDPVPAKVPGLR